jgi:hypothetical protein
LNFATFSKDLLAAFKNAFDKEYLIQQKQRKQPK